MPQTEPISQETKFVKECSAPNVDAITEKSVFTEWIEKDDVAHVHIFKPIEHEIRLQEFEAKKLCDAPWPISSDPITKRKQMMCQQQLEAAAVRRETWTSVRWPDLRSTITQAIQAEGMDVFDYNVDFVPEMDGWHIAFEEARIIPKAKLDKFVESLVSHISGYFEFKSWEWPKEIRQS